MLVSNLQDRKRLAYETLIRSRRRLWLPVEHRLLSAAAITLEDVAAEPYVMLTVDEANQTASRYWKPTGLRPTTVFTTSSVEAVRSMVADGMGVTVLSDMVYRPWSLEGQRIELRNVVADIPTMDVGLAWNHARSQSPAARTFHEFMSLSFGGAGSSV
jgi:DNA-binding transcriptional LysR family regulator